jgi:hypothetical protein
MSLSRALPAFSCAFAIAYLVSMYFHPTFTLFTYAPLLGEWYMGVPAPTGRLAPGMYWYSWLTTGLIAGLVGGAVALIVPDVVRAKAPSALVWAIPVVLTVILLYIERPWFGIKWSLF